MKIKEYKAKLMGFKDKKNTLWILGAFIFILAIGVYAYESSFYYQLYFNNEELGIVQEKVIAENALTDIEKEVSKNYGNQAYYEKEVRIEKIRVKKEQLVDQEELENEILESVEIYKPAAIITIDSEEALVLDTEEQAEKILENIKKRNVEIIETEQEEFELIETTFGQTVEIVSKDVLVDNILSQDEAMSIVEENNEQIQTHKIALGDNAWNISRAYNMGVSTLEQANADKNIEELVPGDTINLVVEKPFVDVTTKIKQKSKAEIDYTVEEKEDASIYIGTSEVKQEGIKGEKEVTKERTFVNGVLSGEAIVEEVVTTEPITKIVSVGTKQRPVQSKSSASSSTVSRSSNSAVSNGAAPTYNGATGSAIVSTAKNYIGVPYVSGGSSPSGFDCSGFTQYVFRQYGISIPRTSGGQGSVGSQVSRSDLQPGDLVVFSGHVGIYVGNGSFIHSPSTGKSVEITSLSSAYWSSKFICGRRVY